MIAESAGAEGQAGPAIEQLEFRDLVDADGLAVLPEFERRIWGGDSEMVSVNVLVATISEGGMAIGAFDPTPAGGPPVLVGAVYGFATRDPQVLHSHYMAVDPAWRRQGLGRVLKLRQRDWCLNHGVTAMRWTFDPLQLNNAHLNLNVLGAVGESYHVNHYGSLGGINGSLPSDRLTVRWELVDGVGPWRDVIDVEVPRLDADEIAAARPTALAARHEMRRVLSQPLADGWKVTGVDRIRGAYTLSR